MVICLCYHAHRWYQAKLVPALELLSVIIFHAMQHAKKDCHSLSRPGMTRAMHGPKTELHHLYIYVCMHNAMVNGQCHLKHVQCQANLLSMIQLWAKLIAYSYTPSAVAGQNILPAIQLTRENTVSII